jgi:ribosomal protein S21
MEKQPLAQGNKVTVVNDQVEKALRKFKKKVADSGLLQDLRERECYIKPTTRVNKPKAQPGVAGRKNFNQNNYQKSCTKRQNPV